MILKLNSIKLILIILIISSSVINAQPGDQPIASLNGGACNFNTVAEAIQAAQPNDVIHIRAGTYFETIGEISIDLTLVASSGVTGCESGANASVVIDGMGQTFDVTGGLVKIINGANLTFRDITLRNASAVNGGVMAIIEGSSVILDNSYIYGGSALSAGGNVYVSSEISNSSSFTLNNGSSIYDGIVIDGNGGGVALLNAEILINEGSIGVVGETGNSASNNGGGIYAESSNININNFNSFIRDNQSDNSGGGIYAIDSTIEIYDATITENTTQSSGGGMYLNNTVLTLTNSRVSLNATTSFIVNQGGAGLYVNETSSATIDSSVILSNESETLGGGVLAIGNKALVTINSSDVLNNSARTGGGIFTNSPLIVNLSRVSFNSASINGGGIYCISCQSLSVLNASQISNNTASLLGGGLAVFSVDGANLEVLNSTISGNSLTSSSLSYGAGISQDGGTIVIESSTISSNSGSDNGGGVSLFNLDLVDNSARIIDSEFFNNSVPSSDFGKGGGALYLDEVKNAYISGTEFSDNISGLDGGAILLFDSSLVIDNSIILNNKSILEGGGIYAEESDLIIENSTINENEAVEFVVITPGNLGGGGIKVLNSNLDLINSKVNQNFSKNSGGGVFYEGTVNNSLTIKSVYGTLSNECLPSLLEFNEYCSEISNNEAIIGAGLLIKGSTNEDGITLSGVALNANDTTVTGQSIVSGVAVEIDITNSLDTDVTMENLILAENDGHDELNKSIIFTKGPVVVNLLSSTLVNNSARPFRAGNDNSAVIVQGSILQQNNHGPLVGNNIPFISLCNNSQAPESGGQSFGPDLGDPQFIPTNRGEYRLADTSPSLDTCSFGSLIDIDGNDRPNQNSPYDQGAFEMNATIVLDRIFKDGFE
ncbi:MAG: hypothetical protein AB8B80_02215 [Marinicellaceae bacterium]